jgi:Ca-activated chloride channel homolog
MRTQNSISNRAAAAAQILRLAPYALGLLLFVIPALSLGQGRNPRPVPPVPPILPPGHADVHGSTRVDANLDGLILQVDCEQSFTNDGASLQEVEILLPVPADAVVTNGLLLADGKEYPAEVLPADEARAIYEEIVRRRRDPALIELVGHGLIRLSAFPIPPGGTRQVSFRYSQSLPAREGRIRLLFPVSALCGLNREGPLDLRLAIDGNERLSQVYSPSHDLEIEREGPSRASLHFAVDSANPHETLEVIAVRDEDSIGVDLRTAAGHGEDDYFLLAVSPGWDLLDQRRRAPKTIVFVLDTSGSMQGEKFLQARDALEKMIEETSPNDRFNLISFSSDVHSLFPGGPRRATDSARASAGRWLRSLEATGGTAIADAIEEAYRQIGRSGLVLFLTDGLPTVGEQDHDAIVRRAASGGRSVRFYAFGVGYDVDAMLLDDLARRGGGSVSYVRPGENIEEAVSSLRQRVEHPCAGNVRIQITGARVRDLYPEGPRDLFAGEPLIFAGRVRRDSGRATIRLTAEGPDGRALRDSWTVDFDDPDARSSAVPVLWASRKAADLIEKIRREGHDPEALAELEEISRRYGILNEEVALLAREDTPMIAAQAPVDRPRGLLGEVQKIVDWRAGSSGGRDLAVRGAAQPPQSVPAPAERKKEVELSSKVWSLSGAGTTAELRKDEADQESIRMAGEVAFRNEGGIWVDSRIGDSLPGGIETIRVRPYGAAYFELAGAGGRIAAWLALGEKVRVQLPGIILEVTPEGEETLPRDTVRRVIEAAESA